MDDTDTKTIYTWAWQQQIAKKCYEAHCHILKMCAVSKTAAACSHATLHRSLFYIYDICTLTRAPNNFEDAKTEVFFPKVLYNCTGRLTALSTLRQNSLLQRRGASWSSSQQLYCRLFLPSHPRLPPPLQPRQHQPLYWPAAAAAAPPWRSAALPGCASR